MSNPARPGEGHTPADSGAAPARPGERALSACTAPGAEPGSGTPQGPRLYKRDGRGCQARNFVCGKQSWSQAPIPREIKLTRDLSGVLFAAAAAAAAAAAELLSHGRLHAILEALQR